MTGFRESEGRRLNVEIVGWCISVLPLSKHDARQKPELKSIVREDQSIPGLCFLSQEVPSIRLCWPMLVTKKSILSWWFRTLMETKEVFWVMAPDLIGRPSATSKAIGCRSCFTGMSSFSTKDL